MVMTLKDLRTVLQSYPEALLRFTLPDGDQIPAHFHVTEVGHVAKRFIDCGGLIGATEVCLLQTWAGDDVDHRLNAATLAKILDLGEAVLPKRDLEVEIEYDCCVVANYPVLEATRAAAHLEITLGNKKTQCLARDRRKAQTDCCAEVATCC